MATRYIVVRMHAGQWQFYAGINEVLGATRWSSQSKDAERFDTRARAQVAADRTNGFVQVALPCRIGRSRA